MWMFVATGSTRSGPSFCRAFTMRSNARRSPGGLPSKCASTESADRHEWLCPSRENVRWHLGHVHVIAPRARGPGLSLLPAPRLLQAEGIAAHAPPLPGVGARHALVLPPRLALQLAQRLQPLGLDRVAHRA